jgi:hypothetical protein
MVTIRSANESRKDQGAPGGFEEPSTCPELLLIRSFTVYGFFPLPFGFADEVLSTASMYTCKSTADEYSFCREKPCGCGEAP